MIEVTSGSELLDFLGMAVVSSHLFDYPDVIVSDVLMPGFSGIDVLTGLKVAGWSIPFILMTALPDRGLRDTAKQLGAVALLQKPFVASASPRPDLTPSRPGFAGATWHGRFDVDLRTVLMNVTR